MDGIVAAAEPVGELKRRQEQVQHTRQDVQVGQPGLCHEATVVVVSRHRAGSQVGHNLPSLTRSTGDCPLTIERFAPARPATSTSATANLSSVRASWRVESRGPSGALSKFAEEAERRLLTLTVVRQRVVLPKLTVRVRLPSSPTNHESSSPTEVL
jgi:hypothetical protein